MMAIRAVIFDIGDTLWKLDPLPDDLEDRMVAALMLQGGIDLATGTRVVRGAMESARTRAGDGRHREPNIAIELATSARRFGLQVEKPAFERVADVVGEADIARFQPNRRLAAVFERLHASGLKLGVLSNTWTRGALLRRHLDDLGAGQHLDSSVYSGDEGIRKPHHDIYRRALERLDVDAGEALFVGDRVREDVIGPMTVGMRAILTHEYRAEDPGDASPAAVIGELAEIQVVVERLSTASGE